MCMQEHGMTENMHLDIAYVGCPERERDELPAHNAQSESGYSTEQSTPVLRHPEDLCKRLIRLGCILKLMSNILLRMYTNS